MRAELRLRARACWLLALASGRFWTSTAPLLRDRLRRWEALAEAIPDARLRALALEKLRSERLNVAGAAMFSTLAPRAFRERAAEASIAVEVIYNYLDALTEPYTPRALESGRSIFRALADAMDPSGPPEGRRYSLECDPDDGGYLAALVRGASMALRGLPAVDSVASAAQTTVAECAEAQVRMHAAPFIGSAQLREWAESAGSGQAMLWQEFVAGAAASGVVLHALIAAAADCRTTTADAARIAAAYRPISTISMMLDSAIDCERDVARTGSLGWIRHFADHAALADRLALQVQEAESRAREARDTASHLARLLAIVAYYASDPQADNAVARPIVARANGALGPPIWPARVAFRLWRALLEDSSVWRRAPRIRTLSFIRS